MTLIPAVAILDVAKQPGGAINMADIEARLKALEKRVRADTERWHAIGGDLKGIVCILDSMGAAIAADNKPLLRTIIGNLKTFEDGARLQNEHEMTMKRVRYQREFFERRLKKAEGQSPSSESGNAPRRGKPRQR